MQYPAVLLHPELSIVFTVKDPSAVNKELLKSATANAREKAEILCEASGVELGKLLIIDYNWGRTQYHFTYRLYDGRKMYGYASRFFDGYGY